ncbi:MAG: hypothetical protein RMZ69_04530 [Nostoc sp. ChiQUE01a]|nr:hypothetical protein [Nostoc sp. ChiQUE01a]
MIPIDHKKSFGLKVHSTFAASSEGVPLGIVNQQVWAKDIEDLSLSVFTSVSLF